MLWPLLISVMLSKIVDLHLKLMCKAYKSLLEADYDKSSKLYVLKGTVALFCFVALMEILIGWEKQAVMGWSATLMADLTGSYTNTCFWLWAPLSCESWVRNADNVGFRTYLHKVIPNK